MLFGEFAFEESREERVVAIPGVTVAVLYDTSALMAGWASFRSGLYSKVKSFFPGEMASEYQSIRPDRATARWMRSNDPWQDYVRLSIHPKQALRLAHYIPEEVVREIKRNYEEGHETKKVKAATARKCRHQIRLEARDTYGEPRLSGMIEPHTAGDLLGVDSPVDCLLLGFARVLSQEHDFTVVLSKDGGFKGEVIALRQRGEQIYTLEGIRQMHTYVGESMIRRRNRLRLTGEANELRDAIRAVLADNYFRAILPLRVREDDRILDLGPAE